MPAAGEYIATISDVIYPQYDFSWRFNGFYSAPLTESVSASVSGYYALGTGATASPEDSSTTGWTAGPAPFAPG